MNTPEEFWAAVERSGQNACWPWLGGVSATGYGRVYWSPWHRLAKRRDALAHQVAFGLANAYKVNGSRGEMVRHLCHNRLCCNPKHLALGTAKDNADDSRRDGRWICGELKPNAKISDEQAMRALAMMADGGTLNEVSSVLDVSVGILTQISAGAQWKHLDRPYLAPNRNKPKGERNGHAKLTVEKVLQIRSRFLGGCSEQTLALDYNVTPQCIHSVVVRRTWKHVA